jgi:hypothetical protein
MMRPSHINPVQWTEAAGMARQSCARIFRSGGTPADAMRAFGLGAGIANAADWVKAVETITHALCTPMRRAA